MLQHWEIHLVKIQREQIFFLIFCKVYYRILVMKGKGKKWYNSCLRLSYPFVKREVIIYYFLLFCMLFLILRSEAFKPFKTLNHEQ